MSGVSVRGEVSTGRGGQDITNNIYLNTFSYKYCNQHMGCQIGVFKEQTHTHKASFPTLSVSTLLKGNEHYAGEIQAATNMDNCSHTR